MVVGGLEGFTPQAAKNQAGLVGEVKNRNNRTIEGKVHKNDGVVGGRKEEYCDKLPI